MATIYNSELTKELTNGAKLATTRDTIPSQLADKVVPVMEVNPKLLKITNLLISGSGTGTNNVIATLSSDRDTYITSATLAVIKDVTATSTGTTLTIVPFGSVATAIIRIPGITLTPQMDSQTITFAHPVKVNRGSTIVITNTTNVANILATATVQGYTEENYTA